MPQCHTIEIQHGYRDTVQSLQVAQICGRLVQELAEHTKAAVETGTVGSAPAVNISEVRLEAA